MAIGGKDDSPSKYKAFVAEARRQVVGAILERRSGHLCSSLSALDLVCTVLLREWDAERGRLCSDVVLSKGHAAPAYYAAISLLDPKLPSFHGRLRRLPGPYEGHPRRGSMPHVPVSTGSLGLGLAWSVGRAIGLERQGSTRRVIVIVSDGELQAGLSYEALCLVARARPKLLTILVDFNGWQTDGPIELNPAGLLLGIGLKVSLIDGHRTNAIGEALTFAARFAPVAIIAKTQRCAGLPDKYRAGPEYYGERLTDTDAQLLMNAVSGG